MKELFKIKNKIREFIRKYEEIIFPILKLIWCFLVFTNVHTMFHYVDLFDRQLVIFLLAVLCAVLPDGFLVFAAGAVIGVNCFVVNLEVGLAFSVVFMVMYCMYIRFFPKFAYAIFLVPICYAIGMPYLAPILIMVISGIGGALPAAFGVMLYHFSGCVAEVNTQLISAVDDSKVEVLGYFVKNFLKNNEMYMVMIVFALAVVLASIVYRFSFPFSHYAAVAAAALFIIILSMITGSIFKETPDMSSIMGGALVGMLIGLVIEAVKGVLDFKHVERVQFEDDDYYYYVKAVPKLDKPEEKKKKKRPAPKTGRPVPGGPNGVPRRPAGPNGANGPQGRPAGPNGANGPQRRPAGPNGANGPQGRPAGPNGANGHQGRPAGPNGANGPQGRPSGPNGANGPQGRPSGPNGAEGRPNGANGAEGRPSGPNGSNGAGKKMSGPNRARVILSGREERPERPNMPEERELQIPQTKSKRKPPEDDFEDLG